MLSKLFFASIIFSTCCLFWMRRTHTRGAHNSIETMAVKGMDTSETSTPRQPIDEAALLRYMREVRLWVFFLLSHAQRIRYISRIVSYVSVTISLPTLDLYILDARSMTSMRRTTIARTTPHHSTQTNAKCGSGLQHLKAATSRQCTTVSRRP